MILAQLGTLDPNTPIIQIVAYAVMAVIFLGGGWLFKSKVAEVIDNSKKGVDAIASLEKKMDTFMATTLKDLDGFKEDFKRLEAEMGKLRVVKHALKNKLAALAGNWELIVAFLEEVKAELQKLGITKKIPPFKEVQLVDDEDEDG